MVLVGEDLRLRMTDSAVRSYWPRPSSMDRELLGQDSRVRFQGALIPLHVQRNQS